MKVQTFTPSMLSTFERCPHQYRHKYVARIKSLEPIGIDLICGNATHAVLQGMLDVYRRTGSHPSDLEARVENALTSSPYPQDGPWSTDVERVATWVETALTGIPGTSRVAQVERWLEYRFPGCPDCPAFLLRHKVDLVLEHQDGTLEHRDWKTGSRVEVDELQNVAARIVVKTAFPQHSRILSSTAFLAHGMVQIDELSKEQVLGVWARMKRLAAQTMAERDWLPASNALCPWCPLYQKGCPLYEAPGEGPDVTTSWLEEAA